MLAFTRKLLIVLNALNWLCALAFSILFALVLVQPDALAAGMAKFGVHEPLVLHALLIMLAAGVIATIAVHAIFTRLIAMLDTVTAGRPFVADNARRLRSIAWALLAIQLLDLLYGILAARLSAETGEYFDWGPSLGGWLAVLLLFVLARVFRQGTQMQDEVEATV